MLRLLLLLPTVALVLLSAVSASAAPSPWRASTIYSLAPGEHALQFCTRDAAVRASDGMVFELVPLASVDVNTIAAASERADTAMHTFSSRRIVRESVVNGARVTLAHSNDGDRSSADTDVAYLYRVEFENAAAEPKPLLADDDRVCVQAALSIKAAGAYMLFTELVHTLVETSIHDAAHNAVSALQCVTGCNESAAVVLAAASVASTSSNDHTDSSSGWTSPVIASLLISLTSVVGVVILSFDKGRVEVLVEYMTTFGAGCLLGVVAFHLYPEGTAYLSGVGHWIMGACVLAGIVFSMSIEAGVHQLLATFGVDHCNDGHAHGHHAHHDHATMDKLSESDRITLSPESQSPGGHSHASHHIAVMMRDSPRHSHGHSHRHGHSHGRSHSVGSNSEHALLVKEHEHHGAVELPHHHDDHVLQQSFYDAHIRSLLFVEPVAWITAVGDFFHAFTDGVVLAVAFKSCSASLGWAVALGIVLHEVPHRVGDFFIFLKAGMAVPQALVVNFVASLASLLGVVILYVWGDVSRPTLGVLLGLGTGALLFIGLTELLPPMLAVRERKGLALHFVWFILGCVVIGLSVLQDTHCHV